MDGKVRSELIGEDSGYEKKDPVGGQVGTALGEWSEYREEM